MSVNEERKSRIDWDFLFSLSRAIFLFFMIFVSPFLLLWYLNEFHGIRSIMLEFGVLVYMAMLVAGTIADAIED